MPAVSDHSVELETPFGAHGTPSGAPTGQPVFWRSAPAPDGAAEEAVTLYLHGVPGNCDEWSPFLERGGGLAVDLPGFGRSGKPAFLRYTIDEYDSFIERFLDAIEVRRVKLVVHDWGAVGLAFAQRLPERVERLTIVNAVPLLPGYRWHRTARIWRTPGLGELAMGTTNDFTLRVLTRESNVTPGPMPEAWRASVLEHFDQGTQRAILRLYRSSPPEVLAAAGERLGRLDVPALVVWGMRDPYIPARFGREYAHALAHAELVELPDAGHWPWLDRPELIQRIVDFQTAG
ncbi:MAG TPA: alpha/beta hydrolase [Solirubrobacteraceae bacterium]|nr:alpha/beta hydrolase [Solirubrobacteraceae bacterium]